MEKESINDLLDKFQAEAQEKMAAEEAKVGPLPPGWRWDWSVRMKDRTMVWTGRVVRT